MERKRSVEDSGLQEEWRKDSEEQYRDDSNLRARQKAMSGGDPDRVKKFFHSLFSTYPLQEEKLKVLEVGCGNGTLWNVNANRVPKGWEVTLTDYSHGMVEHAKEATKGRYTYAQASLESLPFADESFDLIIANFMLYHVGNLDAALSEARRVVSQLGTMHVATVGIQDCEFEERLILPLLPASAVEEWRRTRRIASSFSGENGLGLLQRHFGTVTERIIIEEISIVDPQVVVDSMASLGPNLKNLEWTAIRDTIEAEITRLGELKRKRSTHFYVCSGYR